MPGFASPRIHGDRSDHSHGHRCIFHVASDDSVEGDKTVQVWMESDKGFWFARKKVSLKSASHRSNYAGLLQRISLAIDHQMELLSPPGLSICPCTSLQGPSLPSQSAQVLNGNSQFRILGAPAAMAVPMSSAMNVSGFSGRSVVEHRRHHKIGGEKNRMKKKKKMECWSNAGCSCCRVVRVRGFRTEEEKAQGSSDISLRSMFTEMKGKYGAFGGGATLEKSKLDLSQSTSRVSPQLEAGGGGGNIGNKNFNGGGDGGDDDGDDDDYFGEDGDDDGGDDGGFFGRRLALPEVFDRKIVAAVLQEWFKTMNDLPAGIRQAVELGLISSGQMVRFLSVNARPTVSRAISRIVPPSVSRAFIGRLLADPAFLYKLTLEQGFTIGYGIWWECQHRGDRIRQEWDVAAANVLTLAVCNAAICWSLAPSRSYGSTFKYEFQNTIQKLPNNVFDKSYPLREFDLQKRIYSFFYKAAELSLVGMVTGAAGAGLARVMPSSRNQLQTSVPIPSVSTSALSHGAFLGISGNLRYQLLNGAERVMQQHFNHLGVVLFFSTALRVLNIQIGDVTRLTWLGLGELATVTPDGLQKAYHRPTLSSDSIPGWFIPTRGLISGFFEGNKNQGKEGRQHQTPKMLGKRKVKRKVTAGR